MTMNRFVLVESDTEGMGAFIGSKEDMCDFIKNFNTDYAVYEILDGEMFGQQIRLNVQYTAY